MFKSLYKFFSKDKLPARTDEPFADYCFALANAVLFFLFSNLVISSVVFIFGGHLSLMIEFISMGLTVIFVFVSAARDMRFGRRVGLGLLVLVSALALFLGAILINRSIYDISYDGQTYQQEAVIQLSNGWNPVYQNLDPAVIGADQKWINYYPKSSWINESYIYLLTHEEQTGKALNIILIVVSIGLIYVALRDADIVGKFNAAMLSLLLGLNPVSIYQSLSFYVDGQLMSLFLCLCALFIIIFARKRRLGYFAMFLTVPIFINLKFTGVLDAGILAIVFLVILWMEEREYSTLKLFIAIAVGFAIGLVVIGASPYITNTVRYGTPFYPLAGPGAIDLKPYNVPGNFIDKNSVEIMFLSFFSQSGNFRGVGTVTTYKDPFSYTPSELLAFHYPDPEEGGFGPLFGGAIIVGFLMMLAYYLIAKRRGPFQTAIALTIVVAALCVIDPISSLARYVPQAYLMAMIPIILLLSTRRGLPIVAAYFGITLLFINNYLIAESYLSYNIQTSSEIAGDLAMLAANSRTQPILVYFNEFKSTRIMLDEAGVNYTTTTDLNACPNFQALLPENTTEFCVP